MVVYLNHIEASKPFEMLHKKKSKSFGKFSGKTHFVFDVLFLSGNDGKIEIYSSYEHHKFKKNFLPFLNTEKTIFFFRTNYRTSVYAVFGKTCNRKLPFEPFQFNGNVVLLFMKN